MKIGYLVGNFPVLSETFVSNEIDRVRRHGMDVRVYSFCAPAAADLEKFTPALHEMMKVTLYLGREQVLAAAMKSPLTVLRGLRASQLMHAAATLKSNGLLCLMRAAAVVECMRREGVTHLHAHWPYASQVAYLVNRISGISYSISVHAHEVAHDNGHFPLVFDTVSFATFCNRGAMRHLLAQLKPEATTRSHLIYHGVDVERFRNLPMPSLHGTLSVVSAGRLTPTKGFDRLIRACAAARAAGIPVRLTILGQGRLEASLRSLAEQEGISEHVELPGWVSHDQMTAYLRNAHVFALLADTSFHDGLPNVLLEAMASGRPVIISPLPAASEAVTDGCEGYILSSPDDTTGFVAALKRYQDNAERRRAMGMAASVRVRHQHDAQDHITRLVELFKRGEANAWQPSLRVIPDGSTM